MEEDLDVEISRLSLMQASMIVFSQFAKSDQKLFKVSFGKAPKNLLPLQISRTARASIDSRIS